jgi:hypothetical protein
MCVHVCVHTYVCKGWVKIHPALALRSPRLMCFLLLLIALSILNFWLSIGLSLWGCHGTRLVPWNNDPGDEMMGKLLPHNYIGYVWLILLFLCTFHKWNYLPIPVWKGILLGDSVLWVALLPIVAGFCLVLTALLFCWQRDPIWVSLRVCVHLRNPSASYGLCPVPDRFLGNSQRVPQAGSSSDPWPPDLPFHCQQYPHELSPISVVLLLCSASCMRDWWLFQTSFQVIRGLHKTLIAASLSERIQMFLFLQFLSRFSTMHALVLTRNKP